MYLTLWAVCVISEIKLVYFLRVKKTSCLPLTVDSNAFPFDVDKNGSTIAWNFYLLVKSELFEKTGADIYNCNYSRRLRMQLTKIIHQRESQSNKFLEDLSNVCLLLISVGFTHV